MTHVRMTASRAADMFRTARPIRPDMLTERHLDMLQLDGESSIGLRCMLGAASDAIKGRYTHVSLGVCTAAYNARCGR